MRFRIDSVIEVHADGVILFDLLVEEDFHQAVSTEGFFDSALI